VAIDDWRSKNRAETYTRLGTDAPASKNCVSSSFFACGCPKETTAHFFFDFERYAAIRNTLLISAVSLLGARWSSAGKGTRLKWLLYDIGNVSIDTNITVIYS
jgi:hypothetical protein